MDRRHLLGLISTSPLLSANDKTRKQTKFVKEINYQIQNKRVKQSIMGWTFNPMPFTQLANLCKEIGLVAMEGIPSKNYSLLKKIGLDVSLVGSHGFKHGPVNPTNHSECIKKLENSIKLASEMGYKRVITFTGMKEKGISDQQAKKNCLECWKKVLPLAEDKGVTLCLEHLNSRDSSHPMKGHPGYFGDDVDLCLEMVKQISSENFKLLFDVYHVQIMNGDVIKRIQQNYEFIGHYHVAGNPGRGEIDENQEINYPAVIQAIIQTGYDGFIAHEFIPTWKEPADSLRHAAKILDI
jgi:hydroxypyruvate isomerase